MVLAVTSGMNVLLFYSKVSFEMLNTHCFACLLSDYLSFCNTQAESLASLLALKRGTIFLLPRYTLVIMLGIC